MLSKIKKEINSLKSPEKAEILQRFFKTAKGEYGEGDIFLGINVPVQREIAKKYKNLENKDIEELLKSKIHEHRNIALIIMVLKYPKQKEEIFNLYLKNTKNINNWDLVDISAPKIVGNFLLDKDKSILIKLAKSKNLWEKRISIVSTMELIKHNHLETTIKISEILLEDKHDLIHKAVGWMLRELGKKNKKMLRDFIKKHYKKMSRTMLRYAIEKFPEEERKKYLYGKFN
jgi:3-methyladenine DNA glycosylase AlkD